MQRTFMYVEFQISQDFSALDWNPINDQMKEFPGLKSKTWLSGVNNHTLGGFYEFDSRENAQNYVDNYLVPSSNQFQANLTVKLFDGEVTAEASTSMGSPFFQ